MKDWQDIWARLERGRHVVIALRGTSPDPDPTKLRLAVVDCEAFPDPFGSLDEARRRLDAVLGAAGRLPSSIAGAAARAGLRHQLLEEVPAGTQPVAYAEALDRAAASGPPQLALFLRSVNEADPASLEFLTRLIQGEDSPRLPLLLGFDHRPAEGPALRLLQQLESVLPPEAFWWPSAEAQVPDESGLATREILQELPDFTLRVLRAAATIGNRFESEVVADLLERDEFAVLGALQEAVDRGLPVEDRGRGVFRLAASLGDALRERTLPSLARAWHERLASLFGGTPAPLSLAQSEAESYARENGGAELRGRAESGGAPAASEPARAAESVETARARPEAAPQDWFEGAPSPVSRQIQERPELWWENLERKLESGLGPVPHPRPAVPGAPGRSAATAVPAPRAASDERAASHAEAAGLWISACDQHLAAAERASLQGSHAAALEHASRALALSERIEEAEQRRRVQLLALLLTGRSRWQSRGLGEQVSIPAALSTLTQCRALMRPGDPPELRAELGALLAGVQYDMGTPDALECALQELTQASQLLLEAGRPLDAARLLNDEAAVWVRLGDYVRANYLLSRSREVFHKVAGAYPAARLELAETEHLLARLLLRAPARPGRERDALQLGIEHARAAEEAYVTLGDQQALGRVWETLARLELRLGHLDAAARRLDDARQLQWQLGDSVGLARVLAASADMHALNHEYQPALERLAESIELNSSKGLRAGLEFNRASLRELSPELPEALHGLAQSLEQRLSQELG